MSTIFSTKKYIKSKEITPGAFIINDGIRFTASCNAKESLFLNIYNVKGKLIDSIDMFQFRVCGNVYSLIYLTHNTKVLYDYTVDGKLVSDTYMRNHISLRPYGVKLENNIKEKCMPYDASFDWGEDKAPLHEFNEIFAYSLHVRGFTKHPSSKVKHKGSFAGLAEKIDYLKSLNVNQVILMPAYEFNELDSDKDKLKLGHPKYQSELSVDEKGNSIDNKDNYSLNYWGFKRASYYCPKANYSYSDDFVTEFKEMVKAMHSASIEVIMQMYFPQDVHSFKILDVLRFWHFEYHIDGFQLLGSNIPKDLLVSDGVLCDAKLYFEYISEDEINQKTFINKYTASMNKGFLTDARRFLKSDDDSLQAFVRAARSNPSKIHNINFMSCYEGFTLNDLVTYDYKHNELNNEDNRDGTNYNYSWNCGVEGPSRKKQIVSLRLKQVKNALCILFLSQATPMIFMGDEFLRTQRGNNNPYCQDNDITWMNWRVNGQNAEILDFMKKLIDVRFNNSALHQKEEVKLFDYKSLGYPDLSYHQDMAWKSRLDSFVKHIGLLYAGEYYDEKESIYIAFNMHWENHVFGLPKLEKNKEWTCILDTSAVISKEEIEAEIRENKDSVCVYGRSVLVLKTKEMPLKASDLKLLSKSKRKTKESKNRGELL